MQAITMTIKTITIEQFIAFWIPKHLQNKILQYLLESILDNKFTNISFRFANRRFSPKTMQFLRNCIPFRNDYFIVKYKQGYKQGNQSLFVKKTMKTYVSKKDILNIKKTQSAIINIPYHLLYRDEVIRTYEISKNIDTNTLRSFEYVNIIKIADFHLGLILNERQTIYANHSPYNNGYDRKYSISNKTKYKVISVSPLQMIWRIKCGEILMKELKKLAKINKIPGRSKLNTREDYINAFIKL